jgi:hypothetical protein
VRDISPRGVARVAEKLANNAGRIEKFCDGCSPTAPASRARDTSASCNRVSEAFTGDCSHMRKDCKQQCGLYLAKRYRRMNIVLAYNIKTIILRLQQAREVSGVCVSAIELAPQ